MVLTYQEQVLDERERQVALMEAKTLPMYGSVPDKPGLYLGLYHGFESEEARQATDNWGAYGPLIGPLRFCHLTYLSTVWIAFVSKEDSRRYGFEHTYDDEVAELHVEGDCIRFGNMLYGDFVLANYPAP